MNQMSPVSEISPYFLIVLNVFISEGGLGGFSRSR